MIDYTELQAFKAQLLSIQRQIDELLKSEALLSKNRKDEQKEKVAVYSVTSDRFYFLRASIKSLLFNSDVDKIIVISDADELPKDFPKDIELMTIKKPPKYMHMDGPNSKSEFKLYCLLRVAFHKLFPQYGKILSLDYDTIIRRNISELWDIQLGDDYYVAGVNEPDRTRGSVYGYYPKRDFKALSNVIFKHVTYINAGVMLMNLKKLRDDGVGDRMIEMLNDGEYALPEQDVINSACHRNIYLLDPDYNSCNLTRQTVNPKIVHYARMEKKLDYEDVVPYRDASWERVKEHREMNYGKTLELSGMKEENDIFEKTTTIDREMSTDAMSWLG